MERGKGKGEKTAMNLPKVLSLILAAVVVLNFILFVMKIVTMATFWLVTIISAVVAYMIIPRIKK